MNDSKKRHLAEKVRRLRARFVQSVGAVLGDVLPKQSLLKWIVEHVLCAHHYTHTFRKANRNNMFVKKIIKALIPNTVLEKIQVAKAQKRNERFNNLSPQQVFSEIYQNGLWGKSEDPNQPFYSGGGSHDDKITSVYIANVVAILQDLPHKPNVVDLGCGDFSIGSQIRPFCNNYIACDIVPQLIEHNKAKYKNLNVDFRLLNLITDPLPTGDIVFIRQVLQHLSNEQIQQLIPKLYPSYSTLILTEHLPKSNAFTPNLDKPAGPHIRLGFNSGIVLTKSPFDLQVVDEQLICEADDYGGVIRATMYKLK